MVPFEFQLHRPIESSSRDTPGFAGHVGGTLCFLWAFALKLSTYPITKSLYQSHPPIEPQRKGVVTAGHNR